MHLLSFADFKKNYFRNTIRKSNRLDPDQDRHSVSPDLAPNCFKDYQQMTKVAVRMETIN